MTKNIPVEKCLELTTYIVSEAMRSGKLDSSDCQNVAAYFLCVYQSMADSAALEPSDLEAIIQKLLMKRFQPQPAVQ